MLEWHTPNTLPINYVKTSKYELYSHKHEHNDKAFIVSVLGQSIIKRRTLCGQRETNACGAHNIENAFKYVRSAAHRKRRRGRKKTPNNRINISMTCSCTSLITSNIFNIKINSTTVAVLVLGCGVSLLIKKVEMAHSLYMLRLRCTTRR